MDGEVGGGCRLAQPRKGGDQRFADFDVDIFDIVCEKDRSEANGAFDATLGREGARFDSDPDNNGSPTIPMRKGFASLHHYEDIIHYVLQTTGKYLLYSPAMQFEKPVNNNVYKLTRIAGDGEEGQKSECWACRLPKD